MTSNHREPSRAFHNVKGLLYAASLTVVGLVVGCHYLPFHRHPIKYGSVPFGFGTNAFVQINADVNRINWKQYMLKEPAERVRELQRSRAVVVDDGAALLRRIGQDLHDGAQAQMVAAVVALTWLCLLPRLALLLLGRLSPPREGGSS